MISSNILNADYEPIDDGYDLNDDDGFQVIERRAEALSQSGTKCCIRWSRDSDGQVAYWGPRGATIKPYWYSKPGRPAEMQDGRPRRIYIADADWDRLIALGEGNASKGIRIALDNTP